MSARIHLALVDDWELRGDGSGDMRRIQFEPLRRLLQTHEAHGLKASINAEVMQQLRHRDLSARYARLGVLADEWEELLRDALRRGHDVQLHTHCQWSRAEFDGQKWNLLGDWNITRYPRSEADDIVARAKAYLEQLLRQVDPAFRVRSFRSGSWAIAPSDHMLDVLIANGIEMDISIVAGMRFANTKLALDYSSVEEPFLPYYPLRSDARRVSSAREAIVCLPTFSFSVSLPFFVGLSAVRVATALLARVGLDKTHLTRKPSGVALEPRAPAYQVWGERKPLAQRMTAKLKAENRHYIADLSEMSEMLWRRLVREMRRRARASGASVVPVVLENHTKDLGDMRNIRGFASYIARQDDIEVVTLAEMASNLAAGCYPIRTRGREC